MRTPRSILPKALRRAGKRPLELAWPKTARPPRRSFSKRQSQFLQRTFHEHWLRLGRQDKRARKAAAK